MLGEELLVLLLDFILGKVGLLGQNLARNVGRESGICSAVLCQDIINLGLILGNWSECTVAAYLSLCSSD